MFYPGYSIAWCRGLRECYGVFLETSLMLDICYVGCCCDIRDAKLEISELGLSIGKKISIDVINRLG